MKLKGPLRAVLGFHARSINDLDEQGEFKSRTAKSISVNSKLSGMTEQSKQKKITDYRITEISSDNSGNESLNNVHIHNIEFIHQGHINLCGDACLEMLRLYHGESSKREVEVNSKSIKSLNTNPRKTFEGLRHEEIMTVKLMSVAFNYQN